MNGSERFALAFTLISVGVIIYFLFKGPDLDGVP